MTSGAPQRVFVAGANGYIGRAVVRELLARGHRVVGFVRPGAAAPTPGGPDGADLRCGDVTDAASLARDGFRGEAFDAVISCLASRSGARDDTWRVDYQANVDLLRAAELAEAGRFVLLSAICVQNPQLEFQHAKLAFEAELAASALTHAIVRPTAFFKSVAGQIPRVRAGKPFILFGPGDGPSCQPIGERDLARFIVDCLSREELANRVLPIGGPGPAVSARERGEMIFDLLGQPPRFRRLPLSLFDAIGGTLNAVSKVVPALEAKAEFARIGRFYATEPMLWRDPATGRYDAARTPAFGDETLRAFYARVLRDGLAGQELGDQALF